MVEDSRRYSAPLSPLLRIASPRSAACVVMTKRTAAQCGLAEAASGGARGRTGRAREVDLDAAHHRGGGGGGGGRHAAASVVAAAADLRGWHARCCARRTDAQHHEGVPAEATHPSSPPVSPLTADMASHAATPRPITGWRDATVTPAGSPLLRRSALHLHSRTQREHRRARCGDRRRARRLWGEQLHSGNNRAASSEHALSRREGSSCVHDIRLKDGQMACQVVARRSQTNRDGGRHFILTPTRALII